MIPIMVTTFGCSLIPTLIQNPLKLVRKSKQIANTVMFIATDGTRDNPWALSTGWPKSLFYHENRTYKDSKWINCSQLHIPIERQTTQCATRPTNPTQWWVIEKSCCPSTEHSFTFTLIKSYWPEYRVLGSCILFPSIIAFFPKHVESSTSCPICLLFTFRNYNYYYNPSMRLNCSSFAAGQGHYCRLLFGSSCSGGGGEWKGGPSHVEGRAPPSLLQQQRPLL